MLFLSVSLALITSNICASTMWSRGREMNRHPKRMKRMQIRGRKGNDGEEEKGKERE